MNLMQFGLKPLPEKAGAGGFSRRDFIVTSLGSGFALAAGTVSAEAIHTDSTGLIAGEVSVPVADGKMPAYRARPAGKGLFPVLLVVEEIFGVHEHIKDVCRRYAKLGYFAIAPELYARQGDPTKMTDIGLIMSTIIAKTPDAEVMSDLDATVAYAQASGNADTTKLGVIGYCMGGRTVWLYADHNPKVKAGVAYYGVLEGLKSDIKPNDPIDIAADLKVPVLGMYAGEDSFIKPEMVEHMRSELAKHDSGSEVIIFPGVNHGFNADYRPTYDAVAAVYAAKLAREWLKDHGV